GTSYVISYNGGDGNDVTLTAIDPLNPSLVGTSGDDDFEVRANGGNLEVWMNGGLIYTAPVASLNSLTVHGLDGDDVLTIDYAAGGVLDLPIEFHGDAQATATGDALAIVGGA